jgi:hypothetical protein
VKLVPTFADRLVSRGQHNGSPRPLISAIYTGAATYFIHVAPQLTSRGWVDPAPDPLLLRKSGSARNWTRDLCICSQKLWPLDHRGGHFVTTLLLYSRVVHGYESGHKEEMVNISQMFYCLKLCQKKFYGLHIRWNCELKCQARNGVARFFDTWCEQ